MVHLNLLWQRESGRLSGRVNMRNVVKHFYIHRPASPDNIQFDSMPHRKTSIYVISKQHGICFILETQKHMGKIESFIRTVSVCFIQQNKQA